MSLFQYRKFEREGHSLQVEIPIFKHQCFLRSILTSIEDLISQSLFQYCNLSYQDLQHAYQKENFLRLLKRLFRVSELNLVDDSLRSLSKVAFPRSVFMYGLNSNPPFFLCLNTSFVFTNYQPIQSFASYNRTVRIMHIYCLMQH